MRSDIQPYTVTKGTREEQKIKGPTIIKTEQLTKFYGKQRGIIDLDLEVKQGEVFGFLGPNGAGKTTTIRTLLDFIRPTRGSATIFGLDTHLSSLEIHHRIGYLPGELHMYDDLNGLEYLSYIGNLHGKIDRKIIDELAQRLESDLSKHIRSLSHGNKQKIGLIQAFMYRSELLLLDEPTTGLDPLVQQEFYRLIDEAKHNGQTVFLSSHIMPEVERTCERVGFIRQGRLVAEEDILTLKSHAMRRLEIQFASPIPPNIFDGLPEIKELQIKDSSLQCTVVGPLDTVIKRAARYTIINLTNEEPSLEEIFLTYYGAGENNAE